MTPICVASANMANTTKLMNQVTIGDAERITKGSWLSNSDKLDQVKSLKDLAIGNCRLLYGSERFKFYDIVVCEKEENGAFAALLTCNQNGSTKILRNEVENSPVEAVRKMVEQLQRDTARLFSKYTVGCQIKGQQGIMDAETGVFKLWKNPKDERLEGSDDDTRGLCKNYWDYRDDIPRGPQAERRVYKRLRDGGMENGFRKNEDEGEHRTGSEEVQLSTNSEEGGLPY